MLYGAMTGLTYEAAVCPQRLPLDLAVRAMMMLLGLFEAKSREQGDGARGRAAGRASLPDGVESQLLADANLSGADAMALGTAFRAMYEAHEHVPSEPGDTGGALLHCQAVDLLT